jgi:hypothetical protein
MDACIQHHHVHTPPNKQLLFLSASAASAAGTAPLQVNTATMLLDVVGKQLQHVHTTSGLIYTQLQQRHLLLRPHVQPDAAGACGWMHTIAACARNIGTVLSAAAACSAALSLCPVAHKST